MKRKARNLIYLEAMQQFEAACEQYDDAPRMFLPPTSFFSVMVSRASNAEVSRFAHYMTHQGKDPFFFPSGISSPATSRDVHLLALAFMHAAVNHREAK